MKNLIVALGVVIIMTIGITLIKLASDAETKRNSQVVGYFVLKDAEYLQKASFGSSAKTIITTEKGDTYIVDKVVGLPPPGSRFTVHVDGTVTFGTYKFKVHR